MVKTRSPEEAIVELYSRLRAITRQINLIVDRITGQVQSIWFGLLRQGVRPVYESFKAWADKVRD